MKATIESSALRRGRISVPGQCYLLTTSTANRRPWFADFALAAGAMDVLDDPLTWPSARPWVWMLMPDHLHLLIELKETEALARVMARIKGRIWSRVAPATPQRIRFWQPSFHDHALRRDENLLRVGRYVLENPVRAGLAESPGDWRWRGGTSLPPYIGVSRPKPGTLQGGAHGIQVVNTLKSSRNPRQTWIFAL